MSRKMLSQWVLCLMLPALLVVGCGRAKPGPTPTPQPTSIATSQPTGRIDTGMAGNLSIRGAVKDTLGNVTPNVPVHLTVFEETVFWDQTGSSYHRLGEWTLYTDKIGSYSFDNLPTVEKGHYEIGFSGREHEYEEGGYYIMEEGGVHLLYIGEGNSRTHLGVYHNQGRYVYSLDVTVRRVTNSALCAAIQYQDSDGVVKNYLSASLGPDHRLELNRGTSHPAGHEYTIGDGGFTNDGRQACLGGLAGGPYYLIFQYIQSDGSGVTCTGPSFEIPPGETKQYEYTIRDCSS